MYYQDNYLELRYKDWLRMCPSAIEKPYFETLDAFRKAMQEKGYQDGDLLRLKHYNLPDRLILENIMLIERKDMHKRLAYRYVSPPIEQVQREKYKEFGNTIFSISQFKKLGEEGIREIVDDPNAIITKEEDKWIDKKMFKKNCRYYIYVRTYEKENELHQSITQTVSKPSKSKRVLSK